MRERERDEREREREAVGGEKHARTGGKIHVLKSTVDS